MTITSLITQVSQITQSLNRIANQGPGDESTNAGSLSMSQIEQTLRMERLTKRVEIIENNSIAKQVDMLGSRSISNQLSNINPVPDNRFVQLES